MICFVRRSTIDYDIRLKKYVDACIQTSTPYLAITWDRLMDSSNKYPHEIQYKAKAPYGGGLRSSFQIVGWIFFLYWHLIARFNKYKVIHACNLEIFILVIPFRALGKKIVFDIFDTMSPKIERTLMPFANVLILPNIKRLKQEGISETGIGEKLLIVENVPNFTRDVPSRENTKFPDEIHLAYVGVFEKNIRGIEDTLKSVADNRNLYLDIAGVGSGLESMIEEYQKTCDRIHYYGKVLYDEALNIMSRNDYIVAIYKPSHKPHLYASPNKYYESLFLGRPIISSKGTITGEAIDENNTGYTLNEGDDIGTFLNKRRGLLQAEYKEMSSNCVGLWNSTYKDYFERVLKGEYILRCKSLT